MEMLERLSAPLDPKKVSWRVGSTNGDKTRGMALAYIDARDVMARLDAVCGAGGWQDRYEFHGPRTVCYLSIKIGDEWITKADGAGDSDVEAEKGAISDAFKRAAVKWGIGRYLYDIDSPWVEIVGFGKSYRIADKEHARLARLLPGSSPGPKAVEAAQEAPITEDRVILETMIMALRQSRTRQELEKWWAVQKGEILKLPTHQYDELVASAGQHSASLDNLLAAG